MIELKSKYMEAIIQAATGTTWRWWITSKSSGDTLGSIRWYGPWRQYCFFPTEGTLFNSGCMESLVEFLKEANVEQRSKP